MEIMTRDFGKVNVDESKIFNFPSGLFAFEECRQFALLSPLGDGVYPMWLQSTENVTPCFIVFDPAIIDGAYKITLNSSEKKLLKINDNSDYGEYEMPHSYKFRRESRRTGHTPRKV